MSLTADNKDQINNTEGDCAATETRSRSVPDRSEIAAVILENRERLLKSIQIRLDRRLNGRIDPSDVLQETFLRASAAFDEYCRQGNLPLFNWIRIQAQYAVGDCHRRHLGTQKRSADYEFVDGGDDRFCVLEELAESMISPGSRVARMELAALVRTIIGNMPDQDREILVLRHVEELSIAEAAVELGINAEAAKKRHLRALRRLRELCADLDQSKTE